MSAAQSSARVIEGSYFTLAGESGDSIKKGLLFQTGVCELGRTLKAFVDNRKGIILKTWPYKAGLKPMISQCSTWLHLANQVFDDSSARSA